MYIFALDSGGKHLVVTNLSASCYLSAHDYEPMLAVDPQINMQYEAHARGIPHQDA